MVFLACGIKDGLMLSSVTPKSRKVGMSVGSAAASPQMPTQMPASVAAWAVSSMSRRTAGWDVRLSFSSRALVRSTAMVYWVRSFVPIEKNWTSFAKSAAQSGSRRLDHDADLGHRPVDAFRRQFPAAFFHHRLGCPNLGDVRNHREHDPELALGRRAQERTKLRLEEVGQVEAHPDAAPAKEGVFLLFLIDPGSGLSPPTSSVRMTTE